MEYEMNKTKIASELDERRKHVTLIVHQDGEPDEVIELSALAGMYLTRKDYETYQTTGKLNIRGCKHGVLDANTELEMFKSIPNVFPEITQSILSKLEKEKENE